jgi:hypothetical protein
VRILAMSDLRHWRDRNRLITRHRPDVVILAGDLTSDGFADFWSDALEEIPAFRKARRAIERRFPTTKSRTVTSDYLDEFQALREQFKSTAEFNQARVRLHVEPFYAFLKHAGRKATVLVLKGDHDERDFPGDYSAERIDAIPGCYEVSGKVCTVKGRKFMGLTYGHCRPRAIQACISAYKGTADVVIAHARQSDVRAIAALRPALIVRGHFGGGRFLIDGVPAVFTATGYALINLRRKAVPTIQWHGPASAERELLRNYDWLASYPTPGSPRADVRSRP